MSLRCPRGEPWERPVSRDKFVADSNKAHTFMLFGFRGFRCVCGKVYTGSTNRAEAQMRHSLHQKEVLASIESTRNGNDKYE